MLKKSLIPLVLALTVFGAHAQSTPAKKELAARILKLQQPGIEGMARGLAEQPAAEMMSRVAAILPQRIAPDKQEATARDIQADARKYVESAVPIVQDRAVKLAPSTIGVLLEEKFTEDELKQIVAIIESPAYIKFQGLGGDMQKVLLEKLVIDTRPTIEPKVKALAQSIAKRLGVGPNASAPAAAAPAAPAAATKPAVKKPKTE
jgi:hypothetical protein